MTLPNVELLFICGEPVGHVRLRSGTDLLIYKEPLYCQLNDDWRRDLPGL